MQQLSWLALSAAVTTGAYHSIVLWFAGVVVAWAALWIVRQARRDLARNANSGTTSQPHEARAGVAAASNEAAQLKPRPASEPPTNGKPSALEGATPANAPAIPVHLAPRKLTPDVALSAVLTLQEVASLLRIPEDELVEAIRSGHLPGNHVGDHWRCSARSLGDWLDGDWSPN